jgi:hypothetical protein
MDCVWGGVGQQNCRVAVFQLKFYLSELVIEQAWEIHNRVGSFDGCLFLEGSRWLQ